MIIKGGVFISKLKYRAGILLLLFFDVLILLGLFYLSVLFRARLIPLVFKNLPPFVFHPASYYWIFLIWLAVIAYNGGYIRRFAIWDEVKFLWKCTFIVSITIFTILFVGKQGSSYSRSVILLMSVLSLALFPAARSRVKKTLYALGLMKRKILILGAGDMAQMALKALKSEENLGYEVAAFIDETRHNPGSIENIKIRRFLDRADRYIKRCSIHDVLVAYPELAKERLLTILSKLQNKAESTLYIPDLTGMAVLGTELRHFFQHQALVIEIKNNLARPINYLSKRFSDFVFGYLIFAILIIPIAILSIFIRLTSRGPAIFKQERIGKGGRRFMCFKFRTMKLNADKELYDLLESDPRVREEYEQYRKLKDDPRITGFGRFLRETSLDELPQIFNVIKGEMSLVGPRPLQPREWDHIKEEYADTVLSVPPGITGLWQVSGRNKNTFSERLMLDLWYVRNWNFWLDTVILLKTAYVVLKKEGAG